MGKEIEYKLEAAGPAQLQAVLDDARRRAVRAQPEQRIAMHTRYYDTPDRALGSRRWMLRTRQEGTTQVVTMKTPGESALYRGEWNTPRSAQGAPSRQELEQLVRDGAPEALLQLGPWEPVCDAQFTRRCFHLWLDDGTEVEIAADLGQLCGASQQLPLCEVELELYGGNAETMFTLGRQLAQEHGLQPQPLSKFARARQLL